MVSKCVLRNGIKKLINLKQAAILCGGLGTRLLPLTKEIPKPMVAIHGKPFLAYLLDQLKENGITEVVLMTGYLNEKIEEYFGNGDVIDLEILYSPGPVEWETGRRLYEAKVLLDEYFLLLYSDNFIPFNLVKALDFYKSSKKLLSFVVSPKKDGNIRLYKDGTVMIYDKNRSMDTLDHVELGYMIVSKRVFSYFKNINVSFSDIITELVKDAEVAGMVNYDKYHSISDMKRLALTKEYLKDKKIILCDRDGVINEKAPRGEYIHAWEKFKFIEINIKGLRLLAQKGYRFIVISNQAGIGRGVIREESVKEINLKMKEYLNKRNIDIIDIFVCPHHWEDKCFCRKPNPGLFFEAAQKWMLRLDKTYYIGDDYRDCQAAYNAGCKSIFIGHSEDLHKLNSREHPNIIVDSIDKIVSLF